MNFRQIRDRAKSLTRDFDGVVFREADFKMFANESIDRMKGVIPELRGMVYMESSDDVPKLLPGRYHHLIAVYCASRCFFQDERHYQASTLMNEFESKLAELKYMVESGDESIYDERGNKIVIDAENDYVVDNYFF